MSLSILYFCVFWFTLGKDGSSEIDLTGRVDNPLMGKDELERKAAVEKKVNRFLPSCVIFCQ